MDSVRLYLRCLEGSIKGLVHCESVFDCMLGVFKGMFSGLIAVSIRWCLWSPF